jgi:hypothetical protein
MDGRLEQRRHPVIGKHFEIDDALPLRRTGICCGKGDE